MKLDREYEHFTGGPHIAKRDRVHITLNNTGLIYINKNGYQLFGRPAAVQLFYNRSKDTIALVPAQPHLADAFPVTEIGGSYLIYSSPFCRHFGIRMPATEKFVNPEIDAEGILHLDLRRTVTVSGVRRKGKKDLHGKN